MTNLGPGLITGASDDDPSGIGTYASAGALLGYSGLWTALVTFPLMAAVQFICAKIGMVSGMGLTGVLKRHYSKKILYPAVLGLLIANTINAGADIGAIAAGVNLLVPIPIPFLIVPLGLGLIALQVWCSYKTIAKIFKWLTLCLLAYVVAAFFAKPDWHAVALGTFVPSLHFDKKSLSMLVAILGTTISPYLFFWQAESEVEEEVVVGRLGRWERTGATDSELRYAALDVNTGMFLSNLIMYFIILASAATLHAAGTTTINTAADAAVALRPIAGNAAEVLMALGLIGTGILAVPILTASAAYAVAQTMGWRYGLSKRPGRAKPFYMVLVLSTLVGLAINYIGLSPVDALFWTAVINGFLAPPLLVVIMLIGNNKKVMGDRINGRMINVLGWVATAAMFAAAIGLAVTWRQ